MRVSPAQSDSGISSDGVDVTVPVAGRRRGPRQVRRRLRSLAGSELLNIPLQAVIWFVLVDLPATAENVMGFALFSVLLAQGGTYWLLKARQLSDGRARVGETVYRTLRTANVVALSAGVVIAGIRVLQQPDARSWPGLLFTLFAAFEHVNYFHLQLPFGAGADWRRLLARGPRRSHLAKDLRRA